MVELANRAVEAAWKLRNLEDYDARLERAARRVEELAREHETAALVIYEGALAKSGRPQVEVRELVRSFRDTFEDEEEPLTIPRLSALLNVEDDSWFFGDENLRVLTGRMLGQFQHRVAQYNYVAEREVLKRWADGYDTRLFIRRRIHDTEPVVGVLGAFDLRHIQYLRLISGANTLVPSGNVALSLEALGYDYATDDHAVLARAEELALHLELPAPVVGEMLEDLAREGRTDFPEPPREAAEPEEEEPAEDAGDEAPHEGVASEGGEVEGGAAVEAREEKPSPEDRADRAEAGEDPGRGEEPTRVQDPQAKDAPGVDQEAGDRKDPDAPETGRGGASGNSDREGGA